MLAIIPSATLLGVEGHPVAVEVHVSNGLPGFTIVGLPDAACRESRDRVRAALLSSGLRVADAAGHGQPGAVGHAQGAARVSTSRSRSGSSSPSSEIEPPRRSPGVAFLGELGLDGSVRRVPGIVPLVDALTARDGRGAARVQRRGRGWSAGPRRSGAPPLQRAGRLPPRRGAVAGAARSRRGPGPRARGPTSPTSAVSRVGRAAIEVAAAGGHHLLLVGPPGAGQDDARPPACRACCRRSSATTRSRRRASTPRRACRCPAGARHASTVPRAAPRRIGGVAHRRRHRRACARARSAWRTAASCSSTRWASSRGHVLDALRQPLEEGVVRVSRARASVDLPGPVPARRRDEPVPVRLRADRRDACRAPTRHGRATPRRLSGPLLDRFDLRVAVEPARRRRAARRWRRASRSAAVAERVADGRATRTGAGCAAATVDCRARPRRGRAARPRRPPTARARAARRPAERPRPAPRPAVSRARSPTSRAAGTPSTRSTCASPSSCGPSRSRRARCVRCTESRRHGPELRDLRSRRPRGPSRPCRGGS